VDFYGMLFWESEVGDGRDPGLGGDCTGPLTGACAATDYVDALVVKAQATPGATARDAALALKDRLLAEPSFTVPEEEVVAGIMKGDLDLEAADVDPQGLEDALRRYAGVLLGTPQYMLAGISARPIPDDNLPIVVVDGTSTIALCQAQVADIMADTGIGYSCTEDGVVID
jgi:hypothetical protein